MHRNFRARGGKEATSSHHETKKAKPKFKILQNITLLKARRQDDEDEDQNEPRKSSVKLSKKGKGVEDEGDVSETQSFLNYCNDYILRTRSTSSDSHSEGEDNEVVAGHKNFKITNDNNEGKSKKIVAPPRTRTKQNAPVDQAKKKRNRKIKRSSPEDHQVRKRAKLVEKNTRTSTVKSKQSKGNVSIITQARKNESDKENGTSGFLGDNRKKSDCAGQAQKKEKSRKALPVHKLSFLPSDDDGEGAVTTNNKETKPPLRGTSRVRLSFTSESSESEDGEEEVIRVITDRRIKSKFSDESSVFSDSSAAEEYSSMCADFDFTDESVRQRRVIGFLRKWCPCESCDEKDLDVMAHIERAKSKSLIVGGTLENITLNSSKLCGQESRELVMNLGAYRQWKSQGKVGPLPNMTVIDGVSVNSGLKESNKCSELIKRGDGRVLERESKEASLRPRQLKAQKSRQGICKANTQRNKKSKALNGPQESGLGESECDRRKEQIRLHNKYLDESCYEPQRDSKSPKANGEGVEELQGIKRRLRCKPKEANPVETCKANGGGEEQSQGIKKRLRRRNETCQREKSQQEDEDPDTFQANSEKLQGKKRQRPPRRRNKKSEDVCKPQEPQPEGDEIQASKGDDKSKRRRLFSLETWTSSPEFLALGEKNN